MSDIFDEFKHAVEGLVEVHPVEDAPAADAVAEHNPPPGWTVPPVPTTTFNEPNVLQAAFGNPVSGIFAPPEES